MTRRKTAATVVQQHQRLEPIPLYRGILVGENCRTSTGFGKCVVCDLPLYRGARIADLPGTRQSAHVVPCLTGSTR